MKYNSWLFYLMMDMLYYDHLYSWTSRIFTGRDSWKTRTKC